MKFSLSSSRRLAAATILVSAAALGATGCSATAAASSPSMQSAATAPNTPTAGGASMDPGMSMGTPSGTDANALTIHIKSFAYSSPGQVAPGATVTVMNMDPEAHTVTADDGSFDVTAPAGQSVTFTAPAKPGTYAYHCKYHATMHGTLTVK